MSPDLPLETTSIHRDPKMTMANRVDESPLTFRLLLLTVIVSFGTWFPLGYSVGIINTPQYEIVRWIRTVKCSRLTPEDHQTLRPDTDFNETGHISDYDMWCGFVDREHDARLLAENTELNTIWALVASIMPVGSFIAVWTTKFFLTRLGSKKSLLLNNIFGILGAVLCGLCATMNSFEVLIIGRVVLGINVALNLAVVPLYVAEVSPSNLRGTLGSIPGLTLVTGTLVGIVCGMPSILGTPDHWPILSLLMLVPFGVLYLGLPFFPESPRYLLLTRQDKPAGSRSLVWLRNRANIQDEMRMILQEGEHGNGGSFTLADLFNGKVTRNALFICCCMIGGQQLSGIGAVILFSNGIFVSAGMGKMEALYGTVGVFALQIVSVVVSLFLADKAGRRVLLLVGWIGSMLMNGGMLVFMILGKMGPDYQWAQYAGLACVVTFVFLFNIGPAFIPWLLISEMFDKKSSAHAMTVCSSISHVTALGMCFAFPILQTAVEEYVFAAFACCAGFFAVITYFKVIETKGKNFEEIQEEMRVRFR